MRNALSRASVSTLLGSEEAADGSRSEERGGARDVLGRARCEGQSVNMGWIIELRQCQNTFDNPKNVVPTVTKLSVEEWGKKGKWVVRKHSWAFFMFEGVVG